VEGRFVKIEKFRKARIYQRAGLLHATRTGAPVLKGESSWRTVNGFFVNTSRTGMLCVQFWHHF
jgi:hypothetical protein